MLLIPLATALSALFFILLPTAFLLRASRLPYTPLSEPQAEAAEAGVAGARALKLKLSCCFCTLLAFVASVFPALWSGHLVSWAIVACWILILAQCALLVLAANGSRRYACGLAISASALLTLPVDGAAVYQQFSSATRATSPSRFSAILLVAQASLALVTAIAAASFPRLEQNYRDGRPIAPESSVSALQRCTYTWADPLLSLGRKNVRINVSDLPALRWSATAASLQTQLSSLLRAARQPLWRTLYSSHSRLFHWQWALTIIQSVFSYAPQICIYNLLCLLEEQDPNKTKRPLVWVWGTALGASSIFMQLLGPRLMYLSFAKLEVYVRAQLSAVIFDKALKLDDVKATARTKSDVSPPSHEPQDDDSELSEDDGDAVPLMKIEKKNPVEQQREDPSIPAKDSREPENKQQVLNLIAVDAQRIAEIASRHNVFIGTFVTFIVAVVFLVRLIGWISFCLGLLGPLLFIPLNMKASQAYGGAQGGVMKARDEKLKVLTEALKGIKQVKFTAAEGKWQTRLMHLRKEELKKQRTAFIWTICLRLLWHSSPIVLAVVALSVYSLLNGSISPAVAFTALGVFANLEWCVSILPMATMQLLDAMVSASRIEKFLQTAEKKQTTVAGHHVGFKNATVAWPASNSSANDDNRFLLRGINADFPNNSLSVIHGPSGSGKSLLLAAIIGEAQVLQGTVSVPKAQHTHHQAPTGLTAGSWIVPSSIAFVSQIPWIENASIKDNILFGLPLESSRYQDVLEASALTPDLEMLIDGDLTEVGAQGINLSGGQRWRLTFARALYSRAEILVLDDIFSAVDSHVGAHLAESLTGKLCQGRTRIIATHHASRCLPSAAYAVGLGRGGCIDGITARADHGFAAAGSSHILDEKEQNGSVERDPTPPHDSPGNQEAQKPRAFVEEEQREEGAVKWHTYREYLSSAGGVSTFFLALSMVIVSQLALLGRVWWIKLWTESGGQESTDEQTPSHGLVFYLSIYIAISILAALMEAVKCSFVYAAALRASASLFHSLLHAILRAKLRWLDTVPTGRILNRFTADFALIDTRIPGDTHTFLSAVFGLGVVFAAGIMLSPYMAISSIILTLLTLGCTARYLHGAREIRRLESTAKSPIMELCSSTLAGLSTIRAFDVAETYTSRMASLIDNCSSSGEVFQLVTQWLAVRMGLLGSVYALSVAITIASVPRVDASLAGFALAFALDYTKNMEEAVRRFANLQLDMNSTERVVEYAEMEHESETGADAPEGWPSLGQISFRRLEAGYAKDLPPVLNGISVDFREMERIGIVGRTGAGKSSLALALFRFVELSGGSITVDGIDISGMKLTQLRSRMAIIPQDPVLFSGTIRTNLDPFQQYTDEKLRASLEKVHLRGKAGDVQEPRQANVNVFDDLDSPISEGGLNLSQGQRQLLCLARAILTRSRIMVMDEATSAVDRATDELIQRSIRDAFTNSTLIVIAHRLSTIADFDRALVMADGQAAEFGSPKDLFARKGAFWRLVNDSGEKDDLIRTLAT